MMEEMMDGIEVIHDDDDDLQFADPYAIEPEEEGWNILCG